jgi:hypothetical protein
LRIARLNLEAFVKVFDGHVEEAAVLQTLVVVALGAVRQKINIVLLVLSLVIVDGLLVMLECLAVVPEGVVCAAEAVLDAPVLLEGRRMLVLLFTLVVLGLLKVGNGGLVVLLRMFAQAEPVVRLR